MALTRHHTPCDACGADLRYAPGQSRLVCDHCGHVQILPEARDTARHAALGELDYRRALTAHLPLSAFEDLRLTACPACGAQVTLEGSLHATECPFCATPMVTDTGRHRQIKPQALIPFAIPEEQARHNMADWLGRLWFAPNGLKQYARHGRRLQGIYVPYWTFDAVSHTRYTGQRGTYYYETRIVNDRREQVRRTRWTPVSGRVTRGFDDILVMAATSLPRDYIDGLEPWDLSALVPYRPDFLSGFRAEGYTLDLPEGHALACRIMDRVIAQDIRRDIGGDVQQIGQVATELSRETFKHILLPVWLAAYKYRGRSFRFVVNGQTGEVQGERPWSIWKILFALALATLLAAIALYLGQDI